MTEDARSSRNGMLLEEGLRVVDTAARENIPMRLLGGTAILHHSHSEGGRKAFRRIADLDVVVPPGRGRAISALLTREGYRAEARFNAMHGNRRLIFEGSLGRLDVLVGAFEMCHRLNLATRFSLDAPTVPVTDLLVTKLQVVQLNEKDATDALSIFVHHGITRDEGDSVNLTYLESLVEADWGLWRTMTGTLSQLSELATSEEVKAKIDTVEAGLRESPKSLKFKLRSRVGERVPWYALPDEVRQ